MKNDSEYIVKAYTAIVEAAQNEPLRMVIVRIKWNSSICGETITVNTLTHTRHIIVASCLTPAGSLEIHMMKAKEAVGQEQMQEKAEKDSGERRGLSTSNFQYQYSLREIYEFCQLVGDQNPIHREPPYLVPGIMLFIQTRIFLQVDSLQMRFYHPALAGVVLHWRQHVIEASYGKIATFKM